MTLNESVTLAELQAMIGSTRLTADPVVAYIPWTVTSIEIYPEECIVRTQGPFPFSHFKRSFTMQQWLKLPFDEGQQR